MQQIKLILMLKALFLILLLTSQLIISYIGQPMMETLQAEEHFLDFGYGKIWSQHWFVNETKDKTPIIFIHGGPGFESGYIKNLKILAYKRPCIFYDQSGCGKSVVQDNSAIDWTFEHYVQELKNIINSLGLKKVILFGYSWGAALATQYALDFPQRIEKLILASPYISTSHLLANYKKLAQSRGIYEIMITHENNRTTDSAEYQAAYSLFFKHFVFSKDPAIFDNFIINQHISEVMWGKNELSVTGNLKDLNLIPLLANLNLPVLLTSGRSDTMLPDYMALLHKKIINSKLVIFERSTHMAHIEEEELYCKEIDNFLG